MKKPLYTRECNQTKIVLCLRSVARMQHSNRLDGYYHQTDRMHMHTAARAVAGPHNIDVRCSLCARRINVVVVAGILDCPTKLPAIKLKLVEHASISCGSDGTLSSTDQTFTTCALASTPCAVASNPQHRNNNSTLERYSNNAIV